MSDWLVDFEQRQVTFLIDVQPPAFALGLVVVADPVELAVDLRTVTGTYAVAVRSDHGSRTPIDLDAGTHPHRFFGHRRCGENQEESQRSTTLKPTGINTPRIPASVRISVRSLVICVTSESLPLPR